MSDVSLRDLEREAASGDSVARGKLVGALKRSRRLDYRLMDQADIYALGKCALQRTNGLVQPRVELGGKQVIRPLTFKETLEARVYQYNGASEEERLALFESSNDTCTGIVYEGGTDKFKIVPVSLDLIGLEENFFQEFFDVDYASEQFRALDELDSTKGIYNQRLTQKQVLEHPAWLAIVEQDAELLKEYVDIVFEEVKQDKWDKAMGFWVNKEPFEDQLRAFFVNSLVNSSNADGYFNLSDTALFVQLTSIEVGE